MVLSGRGAGVDDVVLVGLVVVVLDWVVRFLTSKMSFFFCGTKRVRNSGAGVALSDVEDVVGGSSVRG
jgi:hypothetical protein